MKIEIDKISPQDIIDLMNKREKQDIDLVVHAFEFAKETHEEILQISGEPHFIHSYETAKILASIDGSSQTIAAGLLHAVLENPKVTSDILKKEFGEEMVFLIEGVNKLRKLKYHGVKKHQEGLRKLFVAMSQDIRVIIIKLALRLAQMALLGSHTESERKEIAEETLEIFAPIANRLGIGYLKKQLEDSAFPFVFPEDYKKVKELMKHRGSDTQKKLEKVYRTLQKKFGEENIKVLKTDYRLKGLYSLYNKLKKHDMDIEKIYDISALRIIVGEVIDCYKVLGIIHSLWKPLPGRIKDYIASKKPNGYQSIHTTVFTGETGIVEIQIRTLQMHKEAEFGVASHLSYKEKADKENSGLAWVFKLLPFRLDFFRENKDKEKNGVEDVPRWVKELAEFQLSSHGEKFIENLKADFFKERIFVFTPKGDVLDIPIESTPIDFAYAIHSDIGNHIFGAKVNAKFVALDTKLQNGDVIEIQTKPNSHPSEKWLQVAKTSFAQKQIKMALDKQK